MIRICILLAALNGLLSMVIGALGSHYIKTLITTEQYGSFTTAANYQLLYSIVTIAIFALIRTNISSSVVGLLKLTCLIFQIGIILFSGGIYLSTLTDINIPSLAIPAGGIMFMLGWIMFILATLRRGKNEKQ